MQYFYHFTSNKNWNQIKISKKLIPKKTIEWVYSPNKFKSITKKICSSKTYTVGLPEPEHKGWIEYGDLDEIFRLIRCEVLLKIKIPKNSKGFVREHVFCSPKGMKEKYKEDVYFLGYAGKISVNDHRIMKSLQKYWNSAVPITKYNNDFKVPEIWIPEEISISDIEKIPFDK